MALIFCNLKLLSSRCFNSSRINRYSHSINTATESTATTVVSAATVSSAAASDFYKIQQLKQQQQQLLKILSSI
jgi:hypothetical protein